MSWYLKVIIFSFIGINVLIYLIKSSKFFAIIFAILMVGFFIWLSIGGGGGDDPGGAGSNDPSGY